MVPEELTEEVRAGRVVLVLGAGVTAFTTGGHPAGSWLGLIRQGIEFASAHANKGQEWVTWVEGDLSLASTQPDALVSAAEKVVNALGGVSAPLFLEWLTAAVGSLSVADDRLIKMLDSLACPVTTTNYDLLFEQVTGRLTCNWQNPQFAARVLRGSSRDVLHWHGDWRNPASVILGAQSYGEIIANKGAQEFQRAAGMMSSLLFVGTGSGLYDPNFSKLVEWISTTAPGVPHFVLCLESEVEALAELEGPLRPVAYGTSYGDLIPFISGLAELSGVETRQWAAAAAFSLDTIEQRVRSQLIIAEHVHEAASKPLSDILIPPVLSPLPADQFMTQITNLDDPGQKELRSDPGVEALRGGVTVFVGDELAGLTTSLQWILEYRGNNRGMGTPIFLDYLSLTAGSRPLEREIRKLLRPWILGGGSPEAALPELAIAIDNVSSKPTKIFKRMIEDLARLPLAAVYLGCHTGAEVDIIGDLSAAGQKPQVRYLVPLTARDIRNLARIARPEAASEITRQALQITAREHLARTPFTISLLISALVTNDVLTATASETTLLDAYVGLLLGRGDPHDDARFDFDAVERAVMLARLAGYMVEREEGSISESDAVRLLQEYFISVDWAEDPLDVLANLRSRRIITTRQGQIRFVQSSFLHLFAAKYAVQSPEFRQLVFTRPLFYGPILKHYAALQRGDQEVIRVVGALLRPASPNLPPSGAFADLGTERVTEIDVDGLLAHIEPEDEEEPDSAEDPNDNDLDGTELLDLVLHSDADIEPFPLARFEDMPPLQQVFTAVYLVSNVLRDSELVTDLELKTSVLIDVFAMWVDYASLIEADENIRNTIEQSARTVAEMVTPIQTKRDEIVVDVMSSLGAIAAVHGMSSALSSRKLFRTVQRANADPRMQAFPAGQILAALFALDVLAPGFGALVLKVTERYPNVPAVRIALHRIAFFTYLSTELRQEDEQALRKALVLEFSRASQQSAGALNTRLRSLRQNTLAKMRSGQLPPAGTSDTVAGTDITVG